MSAFAYQPAAAVSDAYRRQARHLRCRLANDPLKLHHSLGDLARRADLAAQAPADFLPPQALRNPAAARLFAAQVAASSDDGLLRYSPRQKLLRKAEKMGIGRFEANLIIVAVQHQQRSDFQEELPPQSGRLQGVLIALAIELVFLLMVAVWFWMK
jgi:hypothetical protein